MDSLQIYSTIPTSSYLFFSARKLRILSANRPAINLKKPMIVVPKLPNIDHSKNVVIEDYNGLKTILQDQQEEATIKLYAILEAISDRIEMHNNVKEQRDNWNSLLLNSINMITLTATTMAGISATGEDFLTLKLSSFVLFLGATGLVSIMNKIQPSQLAQEQRNAVRLFKQLKTRVETTMCLKNPTQLEVDVFIEQVLALDRAYPLPLLGAMLEKFPETFKPAVWWPKTRFSTLKCNENVCEETSLGNNGWSKSLEKEIREIVKIIGKKDIKEFERLGNKVLKLNKILAVLGPIFTSIVAIGSGFSANGAVWVGMVTVVAGSVACLMNTLEHGGQVGMVFEMYRNCGGFFRLMEETIESNLEECDYEKRENGELFELKLALKLGTSLYELRGLGDQSRNSGGIVDEFASKLY